jgi:phosphatidylglycerol:prolipoprotein diacylglycerol transferase
LIPYIELPKLSLFGITLHPFGILLAAALYLGYFLIKRRARVVGLDIPLICRGMIWMVAGAVVGGHLVEVLLYHPEQVLKNPLILVMVWTGLSSFGGFIGAVAVGIVFFRRAGKSPLRYFDAIMYGLVPGWILGRLGCSIVHDHPGLHSDFFLAVAYPGGARHDLGFYELLLTIGLTVVLVLIRNRRPFPGFATATMLALYAPVRFGLDFLRVSDRTYFGLTPGHYIAAAALALAVIMLVRGFRSVRTVKAEASPPAGGELPSLAAREQPAVDY